MLGRAAVALAVGALLLGSTVSAAAAGPSERPVAGGGERPARPAAGHDATRPWVTKQVADKMAAAHVGPLAPRGPVQPLRTAARPGAAAAAASLSSREVLGFASADTLGDASIGFQTWDFSVLTTVAYFGIHVNADGSLVTSDTGWAVWHSSVASDFVNFAHARGVKVLLTLIFQDFQTSNSPMCQALANAGTTIAQAAIQVGPADGVDVDYEGTNQTCSSGQRASDLLVSFTQQLRARSLGLLVIDTYAGSGASSGDFFDIAHLSPTVDAFFIMAYGLEPPNGPCPTCMGPTSPYGNPSVYVSNVTAAVNGYLPWAAQSILGLPYYGVVGCVQGPNPPANAPVLSPGAKYTAVPYTVLSTLATNPNFSSLSFHRDALDPDGQERWATFFNSDPQVNCWREAYWDDPISLAHKYDLVNARSFLGTGMFTLNFGGRVTDLPAALSAKFGAQLRVTTSPAVPSQILVDGVPRDTWGLTSMRLPAGQHTISYTHVEGFTEPAPQQVTLQPNTPFSAVGTFTQRGSLRAMTSPAVAAPISVDGVPRNGWGMWTDLPAGSHQVCFGLAAGFDPPSPACQTTTLTAGQLTTLTGTYTAHTGAPGPSGTGQLRVTTSPALPAQILVDGAPMDSWGLNWVDVAPGQHTVSFTHVEGFTEPAPTVVTVTAGATTTLQGTFTQRGSLRVTGNPPIAATVSVDAVPRDAFGMWTDLPAGTHTVCFGFADGLVAPPCQGTTVTAGGQTTITEVYSPVT